jgi:uncharacterized protein (TIGR02268 family)
MVAPSLVALALLLAGASAAAQPSLPPGDTGEAPRLVELSATAPKLVVELRIKPERLTTLLFGAPLKLAGVELEEREGFSRVTLLEDALLLMPSGTLGTGRRLKLRVRFVEGTVPTSADFLLMVSPTGAEPQVDIHLRPDGPPACWREAEAERIQLRQVRAELERERQKPAGLIGLLANGQVDKTGLTAKALRRTRDFTQRSGEPLRVPMATSYRARGVVVLELEVDNLSGQPWTVAGASLVGEAGVRLKVLRVWPMQPLSPGAERQRVLVETEVTEAQARGRFTLSLWQEGESASVSLEGITFP